MDEIDKIIALADTPELPKDIGYEDWLKACVPHTIHKPLSVAHNNFWAWAWGIEKDKPPQPYVLILGRGGGKSTTAEAFAVWLGAMRLRNYILIIRATRESKEESIASIKSILSSPEIENYYPELSERRLGKYKHSEGYRKNLIITKSGVIYRAISLQEAARGTKYGRFRPDCIIPDDIDTPEDTIAATKKKTQLLTRTFFPMGATNCVIFATQNLVKQDGFFGKIESGEADYLTDAIVAGPIKSVQGLKWKMEVTTDNRGKVRKWAKISDGIPTWEGQSIEDCQNLIKKIGISAFLRECQHDVRVDPGGMFEHEWFRKVEFLPYYPNTRIIRYWDKGATRDGGSFTAGVLMAFIKHGPGFDNISIYFLDEVRGQWAVTDRENMIIETAKRDREAYGEWVKIYIEQEPGGGGKDSVRATISRLGSFGFTARADRVTTAKTQRAEGLAAQAKIGNVRVLDRPFVDGFINRMVSFPNKADTGDAASGAFRMAVIGRVGSGAWS
jgi:predicted phage terminase large subunit-like protein